MSAAPQIILWGRTSPELAGFRTRPEHSPTLGRCISGTGWIRRLQPFESQCYILDYPRGLLVTANTSITMAPGRIDAPTERSETIATSKPTVYLLDTFHPTAVKHAQTKFNIVLPSDPKHTHWRENAEYLLIRGSYLRKEDVDSCPRLKAIGKQGVGMFAYLPCFFLYYFKL